MNKSIIIVYGVVFLFILALKTGVDHYHPKLNASGLSPSGHNIVSQSLEGVDKQPFASTSSQSEMVMQTLCLSCHSASANHEQQEKGFAPPMWGVRDHYLEHHETLDAFTSAVASWVQSPDEARSLMRGAVKRFGVMPGLNLSEDQLTEIATLIYHGVNVEKPTWWDEHQRTHHAQQESQNPG